MTALRLLRRRNGWTQAELARAAGVSRQTVIRLERGVEHPAHPATLRRIAAALGVAIADVDEFADG